MSNRSYTFHAVPQDWINPDPRLADVNYNYRVFLIQTPISNSIFLTKWMPPNGPEVNLIPTIGDLIKIAGDPRTFKISFTQKGTDPSAAGLDFYVEVVTANNPESDPLYPYEDIAFQKIF